MKIKRVALVLLSLVVLVGGFSTIISSPTVLADDSTSGNQCNYQYMEDQNFGEWTDPCDATCGAAQGNIVGDDPNKDYTGSNDILSSAQLAAITANEPVYKQAGTADGVPWQMIAVIHLRETGLKLVNPTNGQGLFQDAAKINGPYPAGPVSAAEFLRQATWAGTFLKNKSSNPAGVTSGNADAIKDAFFGYNGRAAAYVTQAKNLGFTNGADGSPYVMNKADSKRDPAVNKTTWGQIKADGGSLVYPANNDYGAYVVYASIAGIAGSSDCADTGSDVTGTLNEKIVKIAQQELALWQAGKLKPGTDFEKYTYGVATDWCAYFVSWVLKQAGHPVNSSSKPAWPVVGQFTKQGSTIGFTSHPKGDGYKPKAGDFAIYGGGAHINIVVGYNSSGSMLTIGGNQAPKAIPFTQTKVSEETGYGASATSYIEVK